MSAGYVFALPHRPFEIGQHGPFGTGILAEIGLGLGGAKAGVGYSALGGAMGAGSAKVVAVRTWKDPWGANANATLIGPELTGRMFFLRVSIGYLFAVTKAGESSYSIGVGFGS